MGFGEFIIISKIFQGFSALVTTVTNAFTATVDAVKAIPETIIAIPAAAYAMQGDLVYAIRELFLKDWLPYFYSFLPAGFEITKMTGRIAVKLPTCPRPTALSYLSKAKIVPSIGELIELGPKPLFGQHTLIELLSKMIVNPRCLLDKSIRLDFISCALRGLHGVCVAGAVEAEPASKAETAGLITDGFHDEKDDSTPFYLNPAILNLGVSLLFIIYQYYKSQQAKKTTPKSASMTAAETRKLFGELTTTIGALQKEISTLKASTSATGDSGAESSRMGILEEELTRSVASLDKLRKGVKRDFRKVGKDFSKHHARLSRLEADVADALVSTSASSPEPDDTDPVASTSTSLGT